MYYFTADEHFGHEKILTPEYSDRAARMSVANVSEMNEKLISNHNERVTPQDVTIHAGDFCWFKKLSEKYMSAEKIIKRLNGTHHFIKGSHDAWLPSSAKYMWRKNLEVQGTIDFGGRLIDMGLPYKQYIVVCHYAMRRWERSHYGAWQLHGHSHGRLESIGLQHDVGVDNNNYYPVSLVDLVEIMKHKRSTRTTNCEETEMAIFLRTPASISKIRDFTRAASRRLKTEWKWEFFFRGVTFGQYGLGIMYRKKVANPCCDSPDKDKCDQCQETGLANPLNQG